MKKQAGFVLPLSVILIIPLLGLIAFATDLGRALYYQEVIQASADNAVLAGATRIDNVDVKAYTKSFFEANTKNLPKSWAPYVIVKTDEVTNKISLTASSSFPTTFARVLGISEMPVSVVATAKRFNNQYPYEYKLVSH